MAIVRIGGPGSVNLPVPGLKDNVAVAGTAPFTAGFKTGLTNAITMGPGEIYNLPSGTYMVKTGPYTFLQYLDPIVGDWHIRPTAKDTVHFVNSDGSNFRLANTTGCPIGAVITTSTATGSVNGIGTATTLISVAASSGASVWTPIVGGSIGATIATATTTAGTSVGSGYLYPPLIVIDAPPAGGFQATAVVTSLAAGTVQSTSIQVLNQGAGYASVPAMNFINDPRDTAGKGAVYVTTLTATGTLTGLYPTNHGTPLTGVPALTFALTNGAAVSCSATAIMNFTVTAYATGSFIGSSISAANIISNNNVLTATAQGVVNPLHTTGLTFPRPARINAGISAGTVLVAGATVEDAGLGIQQVPNLVTAAAFTSTTGTNATVGAASVGGQQDTSYVQMV